MIAPSFEEEKGKRPYSFSVVVILVSLAVSGAHAQSYPNKPVHIVTADVGGSSDFMARLIAQGIAAGLAVPVVVDNRIGGITVETVQKAPPDGYTLLFYGVLVWIEPLMRDVPWDALRDFAPITLAASSPSVIVVHPSLPVQSVKQLIALAKARPGELNYGATTVGGIIYLSAELFKSMAGVNIVHVPYKGTAPALNALVAGEVQLSIPTAASVTPHVKSGRLKALAVTSAQTSALLPGLPTVAASGLPGYESVAVNGMLAPAKTPPAVINRLHQEVVRFLNTAEARDKFFNAGAETVGSTPEEFTAAIKAETIRLGKVIKDAGIRGK